MYEVPMPSPPEFTAPVLHGDVRPRDYPGVPEVRDRGRARVRAAEEGRSLSALVAGFLPIVGVGTALTFGLAVGLGVSAGRGDVPRLPRV